MPADLKKRGLFFAALILFTDALAGSLGISVLPYFVQTLGGEPSQFGMLISIFATGNILASLWIGTASDKFGRMPLLIASLFGMSIGFVTTGLTTSIGLLFIARFMVGFFAGVGATARAYVAEICDSSEEKAKYFAQLGGLMMLGFAAGPPVGSALQGIIGALGFGNGLRTPFLAGGAIAICMSAVVALRMPRVKDIRAAANADAAAAGPTTKDATSRPQPTAELPSELFTPSHVLALGLLLLNNVFAQVGMAMFIVVMPLFINDMFGWGSAQFGILMSTFILGMAVGQMALFPKLAKAFGMMRVGVAASLVAALMYFALSFVRGPEHLPFWLVATAVQILSGALAGPIVSVKIAELAPGSKLGMTMGFASAAEQIGRVFAPTMAAYAYENQGPHVTFRCAVLPVLGSAACFAVVAYVQAAQEESRVRLQGAIRKVSVQAKVVSAFKVVGTEDNGASIICKKKSLSDLNIEASTGAIEGGFMGVCPHRSTHRRSVEAAVEVRRLHIEIEAEDNEAGGKTDLL